MTEAIPEYKVNDKALPCPFCGSHNIVGNEWAIDDDPDNRFGSDEFGEVWAFECSDCLGAAPMASWNKRHTPTLESTPGWHYPKGNDDLENMPAPGQIVVLFYEGEGGEAVGPVAFTPISAQGGGMSDIKKRLLQACNGHPDAKIPWPHRILHEAVEYITALEAENAKLRDAGAMVNRFLCWKLPKDFAPDGRIKFDREFLVFDGFNGAKPADISEMPDHYWPTGTNLFTAEQAKAMIEHMLGIADE